MGKHLSAVFSRRFRNPLIENLQKALSEGAFEAVQEVSITAEGPQLEALDLRIAEANGEINLSWRDGTEHLRHRTRLQELATHDGLTGLFNRSPLMDRLTESLVLSNRMHGLIGVLMLDIDDFKLINDRFGHAAVVTDLAKKNSSEPWRILARKRGFGSAVAIPLEGADQINVVLTIFGREAGAFDAKSQDLLAQMTTAFSLSLTRRRDALEMKTALEGTLMALGSMTERRDPYTMGHQRKVGELSAAIATQMGLVHSLVELVRQAGEVHDVGKYIVPTEILSFTGKLDPIEFEMVKRHSAAGAAVLNAASLPWPLGDVALQHHERVDGSGYPAGLHGGEICLPAQIVGVADVVEAMDHLRPYRAALGTEAALAEIQSGRGTRYDENVADACFAVFEGGFTFTDPENVTAGVNRR